MSFGRLKGRRMHAMEKKKVGAILRDAGNAAKGFWDNSIEKAVQAVDQNGDGKINLADVSAMAGAVGGAVKKGAQDLKQGVAEKAIRDELKALRPFFTEILKTPGFTMPKLIRVAERDKKHADSALCEGAIGFLSNQKGTDILTFFKDSAEKFGFTFIPNADSELYYADPSNTERYIALDEYFGYLKVVRINELQRIAQDLGAKHFRVTYKEEKNDQADNKVKLHGKNVAGAADLNHSETEKKYSTIEIAAEMDFPGHSPVRPILCYMQRDPSVQNLIEMRMNEISPLMHQKYLLKLSNSSGITESDAVKIDSVLKQMKFGGNIAVANEARKESHRYLEYEIDF